MDGPTRKHVGVCVKSCCYASNCYRQVLTCACNVAFAGSRNRLAVLQPYQVLCALVLNQMLGRNDILVMGKCEEKLFGFLFLGGKCWHRVPGPCWCVAHMHVWQVALQKGVAIMAVSGPGDSPGNLCIEWDCVRGLRGLWRSPAGGLAAQTLSLHFPFLQEEVFSFLVTPHLELCKQHSPWCWYLQMILSSS